MSLPDRLKSFENCLQRFEEVLQKPKDEFIRDSAIKRFELCFELCWKTLKDFLAREGIICRSPRGCFKEAYSLGLIEDKDEWLLMLEDRNLSVHTYSEELAEELYSHLKGHLNAMKQLLRKLKKRLTFEEF